MMTDPVLEVKRLSVDYASASGAVHAVDDVSFTLRRGQIFGLAGESGSGKSTLAYAIARLLRPPAVVTQGEVWFYPRPGTESQNNESLLAPINVLHLTPAGLRAFRWRRLSIVFQSAMNALNPVLDISTQITDVLRAHEPGMSRKAQQERALELLRLVGIAPDRLHSYPHELSGGMRQRAIIAIALALNPDIIIMDEPTTALDVVVQREILAEIKGLRERLGFSVIFITHDLSLLLEMSDQLAIMYAGRLVETATQRQLNRQPRHPYTYGLLHSFPKLRGPRQSMTGIPGSPPDLRAAPSGCAFHPRCSFAFEACHTAIPGLLTPCPDEPTQQVACHLYNASMQPPGLPSEFSPSNGTPSDPELQKEPTHEHSSPLY
ncbi:MAG TPA: ABC transporter ATP-binding protein [Ktedonobacterales bacterium]|jgi:peptide/nickel transport system ATP-binding protein